METHVSVGGGAVCSVPEVAMVSWKAALAGKLPLSKALLRTWSCDSEAAHSPPLFVSIT